VSHELLTVFAVALVGASYPFGVYPIVLAIASAARARPRAARTSVDLEGFTVIIPAHNEARVIERKLLNTLEATRNASIPAQIVVAADGCTDDTCEIAKRFAPAVDLIQVAERGGIVGALKAGMRVARYPIVVFSDADITVDASNYAVMIPHFLDPTVGGACGATRMQVLEGSGLTLEHLNSRLRTWIRHNQSRVCTTIGADGANWAVRTSLVQWPQNAQLAEDLVVPLEIVRRGYRFVFEPRAGALETSPQSVNDEYHRKVRTIAGGIQAGWYCRWMFRPAHWCVGFHYASWKLAKYAVSGWVILAVVAVMLLAPGSPTFRAAAWLCTIGISVALTTGLARRFGVRLPIGFEVSWYALVTLFTPIAAVIHLITQRATTKWRMAAR
jgi:cellulose synthase/poly-beta-1,6-N-acetylglucosamine synthase-like glycosyltransferase